MNHVTFDQLATFARSWLGLHAAYRKYAVALAGVIGQIVSLGVLHGSAASYAAVILAVCTALGVRQATNTSSGADAKPADQTGSSAIELCVIVIAVVVVLWAFGKVR